MKSLILFLALFAPLVYAQERYPSKPVELIVPWGPGGGADILGRIVAKWLETDFKASFTVVNLPGATGTIGLQKMVANGGDAHSIGVLTGDTLTMAAFADSPFRLGEIVALSVMIRQPSGLFVRTDGRYKSWEELVASEQAVVLETDPIRAREIARLHLSGYIGLPNYTNNWKRIGYTDDDLADGGSDRLVDAFVAWGDESAILERVQAHRDAGADHVCIQALSENVGLHSMDQWRALAPVLVG